MAKRRKIRNMTRVEHKRALEGAVRNQIAAMQEMRGQVFLPKLSKHKIDSQGDVYQQVVQAGQELLQKRNVAPGSRRDTIISYYSRKDVQRAMYQYARGRKISVLRNFRPMFQGSELREPEDILPIMMFYSQEARLWPSIHGTVSRHDGFGRTVCDLVVEVDFKKSRERSFGLARPLIRLFLDLDIEFRVKFSGNASPHIIIPAEAFPRSRCKVSSCRNIYGRLLEFFRKQIKEPKVLDGSFRNPGHFLRMPYSLNENTGMVSVPIRVEEYDRFSWRMAHPDSVIVMEDWWSALDIPEDAPERTEELIQMALGKKKVFAVKQDRRDLAEELTPQMPDVLGTPVRMGMVKTGEQIAARGNALMEEHSIVALCFANPDSPTQKTEHDALHELRAAEPNDARDPAERWQFAHAVAQKHGIDKQDMQLLWHWSDGSNAFAYYSRLDVQEIIYSHVRDRCVLMEGTDEYLMLGEPSDVPALAAYMVGGGVVPVFRCTNARYDPGSGEMTACDVVIKADRELASPVALLLRGFDMPSFVLYNGEEASQFVIPFEVLEASGVLKSPLSQLLDLAESLDRHLRRMLKSQDGIHVSLYEGLRPVPYSLADDGEKVSLPVRLEDVPNLSPDAARATAVETVERIESFIPPDAGEKAAKFFRELIL